MITKSRDRPEGQKPTFPTADHFLWRTFHIKKAHGDHQDEPFCAPIRNRITQVKYTRRHRLKISTVDGERWPAILISSGPHKIGAPETPWQDLFDPDNGHIRYYGYNNRFMLGISAEIIAQEF
jgi:hypothetical protein